MLLQHRSYFTVVHSELEIERTGKHLGSKKHIDKFQNMWTPASAEKILIKLWQSHTEKFPRHV